LGISTYKGRDIDVALDGLDFCGSGKGDGGTAEEMGEWRQRER
jgi:hypothetical protein